jgi:cell division protein FtsN
VRSATPAAPGGAAGTEPAPRDPAAILADRPPAAAADPTDSSVSTKPRDDPFMYFVQAGAYGRPEDAEQQRAKLAMMGIETRVTEREQGGRTVYRVRVGPFDRRDQADTTRQRLEAAAIEAALVRVQK